MPNYTLTSKQNPRWHVLLANCDLDHAKSVLVQLLAEPSAPDDIVLVEENAQPAPPAQTNWLRRLLNG